MLGVYNYTVVLTYFGMLVSFLGITFAAQGNLRAALTCLIISGVCDMFDGKIASTKVRTAKEKRFGIQIDSLSDLICFGVLPAMIVSHLTGSHSVGFYICGLYLLNHGGGSDPGLLARESYGGGEREYRLSVTGLLGEDQETELRVKVAPREYTEAEAEEVFWALMEELPERILGENENLQQVERDLNLIRAAEEQGIRITWYPEDTELISYDGRVHNESLGQPVDTGLKAVLSDGSHSASFFLELRVQPRSLKGEERILAAFRKLLTEEDRRQINGEALRLPDSFEGRNLSYGMPVSYEAFLFLLLGAGASYQPAPGRGDPPQVGKGQTAGAWAAQQLLHNDQPVSGPLRTQADRPGRRVSHEQPACAQRTAARLILQGVLFIRDVRQLGQKRLPGSAIFRWGGRGEQGTGCRGGKLRRGKRPLKVPKTLPKPIGGKEIVKGGLGRDSGDRGNPQGPEVGIRIREQLSRKTAPPAFRVSGYCIEIGSPIVSHSRHHKCGIKPGGHGADVPLLLQNQNPLRTIVGAIKVVHISALIPKCQLPKQALGGNVVGKRKAGKEHGGHPFRLVVGVNVAFFRHDDGAGQISPEAQGKRAQ